MLTNFSTVYKRLQRLKELEQIDFEDVAASGLTKKELLVLSREKAKLEKTLGGIREMSKVPSAVWIVDTKKEHIAVGEARKLNIPVVAILDTNCDPDEVDYKIPGNDDAIRSVTLLTRVIADAVAEGLIARSGAATGDKGEKAAGEPLAEWERDLLEGEKKAEEAPAAEAEKPAEEAPAAERLRPPPRPPPRTPSRPDPSPPPGSGRRGPTKPPPSGARRSSDFERDSGIMANYTAADVKKLRELTGAGMMDCKKALDEAEGNVEKAVEALRIKGQKGVAKREGRSAENGAVVSIIADDNTSGVLVELKCETDFVAKGEKFQNVATAIAEHVAKAAPADIEALLASEIEPGKTVQAFVDEANANLGEKIVLDRFAQFSGGFVTAYMHRTMPDLPPQIGVPRRAGQAERRDRQGRRPAHRRLRAEVPLQGGRPGRGRRVRAPCRRGDHPREGKPEAALPKIVEVASTASSRTPPCSASPTPWTTRSPSRRCWKSRCHPEALHAHQGRHLSPYRDGRATP